MKLPACIFDWDGVVVDSNAMHVKNWDRLAEEEGRPSPQVPNIGKCGLRTEAVLAKLLQWNVSPGDMDRLAFRKEELFRTMVAEEGIDSIRGVIHFLQALRSAGHPVAVGSSAPRLNVDAGIKALAMGDAFNAIVAGEDVAHGKPFPDIFLLAAKKMGVDPAHCVVFEDAPAGIQAAHAAGMRVIGVLSSHTAQELKQADMLIHHFGEMTPERIIQWFPGLSEP
ncbi:MAG: HAD family phosphatase [Lentisphaerota bacterium]